MLGVFEERAHGHVLLPKPKLRLQLVVLGELREEGFVGIGSLANVLELTVHAVHDLLTLFT